jgi:cation transport ATPase
VRLERVVADHRRAARTAADGNAPGQQTLGPSSAEGTRHELPPTVADDSAESPARADSQIPPLSPTPTPTPTNDAADSTRPLTSPSVSQTAPPTTAPTTPPTALESTNTWSQPTDTVARPKSERREALPFAALLTAASFTVLFWAFICIAVTGVFAAGPVHHTHPALIFATILYYGGLYLIIRTLMRQAHRDWHLNTCWALAILGTFASPYAVFVIANAIASTVVLADGA